MTGSKTGIRAFSWLCIGVGFANLLFTPPSVLDDPFCITNLICTALLAFQIMVYLVVVEF
jgi:hypothetical protein